LFGQLAELVVAIVIGIWDVIGEFAVVQLELHSMIVSAVLLVFGRQAAVVEAPLDTWLLQVY